MIFFKAEVSKGYKHKYASIYVFVCIVIFNVSVICKKNEVATPAFLLLRIKLLSKKYKILCFVGKKNRRKRNEEKERRFAINNVSDQFW